MRDGLSRTQGGPRTDDPPEGIPSPVPECSPIALGCDEWPAPADVIPRSFGVHTAYVHWNMREIEFEWDPKKAKSNLKKHGVSFEEASTAFWDDHALVIDDPDHSLEEERFVLLGLSSNVRLATVVHCFRSADDVIRIISARRATPGEQSSYQSQVRR